MTDRDLRQPSNALRHASPVLVGREREQVFLREELAATLAGHGRLVLVGGEAGIGKTTLARDLARDVAARDMCVLSGHCYDLTNTSPYGSWLDLVATYPSEQLPPLVRGCVVLETAGFGRRDGSAWALHVC